jgi:nucleoid-associated protein YgaU
MTSVSIVKMVASASVLVAASSAALVFGLTHVQHEERLETGTVTATTSPSEPTPGARNEASPALAATAAKVTALAAELAPSVPAAEQSVPSFDLARIEGGGDAVIAGRAAPGAVVDLLRDGERLDRAVADATGQFVMVPPHLPAGSYELTLSAKLPDGTMALSKQRVPVTVNDLSASSGAAGSRAEYLPETASQARPPSQPPLQPAKLQESASSAPNEGVASPAVAPKILTKLVSRGDSLWRISRITYGTGTQYAIVYRANRDRIRDPNLIHPGQILVLPMRRH